MKWEQERLTKLCTETLHRAHEVLESLGEKGRREVHDAHVTDISTEGDMAVSRSVKEYLRQSGIPAVLYTEEYGMDQLSADPRFIITFDDIDGTDNYSRGLGSLPYSSVVAIFDSLQPTFEDALSAGVIEHTSGNEWLATRGGGCYFNGKETKTSGRKTLDRRSIVIIDHYMSAEEIGAFLKIYPKAWVKDFSTSALHMAGISSGMFDAYVTSSQKAHESGAGYLLIKEAGGYLIDFNGNALGPKKYDFNDKHTLIAAATRELAEEILSKIV